MGTWLRRNRFKRKKSRQSVFGGTVKTVEQVEKLALKIEMQEAAEFKEFEKNFDADLRNLQV